MDRTLPNGRVIKNVPENISEEEFRQIALYNNWMAEEDMNKDYESNADLLPFAGELTGSVAGSLYGASLGTAIFPVAGTLIGGVVGGAIGAFGGSYLGSAAEASMENRALDTEEALVGAQRAAVTDAAFGLGFGVLGKGFSMIAKPLSNLFSPKVVSQGLDTSVASVAADIQAGKTTLERALDEGILPPTAAQDVIETLTTRTDELGDIANLQAKLAEKGGTLLPSQAIPEFKGAGLAQEYAGASFFLQGQFDSILKQQDNYITKQITDFFDESVDLTRDEIGLGLKALVNDADKALKETVDPLYRAIDEQGAVFISGDSIKQSLRNSALVKGVSSPSVGGILRVINKIPSKMTPIEATKQKARLRTLAQQEGLDSAGKRLINQAIKMIEGKMNGPEFVRGDSLIKMGKETLDSVINESGSTAIRGKYKAIADTMYGTQKRMSFSEAHQRLSALKAEQRDLASSIGEKSSKAESLIARGISELEKSMDITAKNLGGDLSQKYSYVKNFYKSGIDSIHGDWIVKSLNKDNPAKIAEFLVKSGENVGVEQVNKLVSKAKQLGTGSGGENILKSMRNVYLKNQFPNGTAGEVETFIRKINQPAFRDTFNAIMDQQTSKKVLELAKEVDIMSKGLKGSESSVALSVRAREYRAAQNIVTRPTVSDVPLLVVGAAVRKSLSPEEMTRKINMAKAINSKVLKNEKIPMTLWGKFVDGLETTATSAGFAVGSVFDK
jgi:hypothetical protein